VSTSITPFVVALTLATAAGSFSAAHAQELGTQSPRPFQSLFGGGTVDTSLRHSFDVTASVTEAYDDNLLEDFGGTVAPSSLVQESGFYTGVGAGATYAWNGKRVQVGANVGTYGRYYHDAGEYLGVNQYASFGVAANFARRTRLFANQSLNYSPAYFYGLFPDAPVSTGTVVGTGDPLAGDNVLVYDTAVSLSHGISRRADLEALAHVRYSDFGSSGSLTEDLTSYELGGRYRYNWTREATVRLGYFYRKGGYGYGVSSAHRNVVVHDIDVGIDYRKALSVTRRTTIEFGAGPAIVNEPVSDGMQDAKLTYRLKASVGLNNQAGRTWKTNVFYSRGVGFTEGFPQPVYSDAVNATVSGFFSRRVDFRATAGVAVGEEGLSAAAKEFHAYSASARARMALGRLWALVGEYQFYKHDLTDILLTSTDLPNRMNRNTASIGLTFWFPLVRR
jgi:hypothetical protein